MFFYYSQLSMLRLNQERLVTQVIMVTQVIRADLSLYLGSKLKLEKEEGLKGVLTGVSFLPYYE